MTGKGDRTHTETPYDKTRGNVALAKLATALGVKLDSSLPDHVLLEQMAEAVQAGHFRTRAEKAQDDYYDLRVR